MDKLTRNFIASLCAGVIKDLPVLITHIFWDFPKIAYWSYASRIGFGKDDPISFFDYLFAVPIELLFGAAIGMSFIFIIDRLKPKHYLLAGTYLGLSTWFVLRSFMTLYKIPPFERPDIKSAVINCLLSMLFGFSVIYINNFLKKRKT
jgi:hypothetical protein